MSTKIYLETPDAIHAKIKRMQLDQHEQGNKKNLKDVYYQVLEQGIKAIEQNKKAGQN